MALIFYRHLYPLLLGAVILLTLPNSGLALDEDMELLEKAVSQAKAVEGNKLAEYQLLDQDGRSFKVSDYLGAPLLVSFVYTTCPDICNSIVATLAPSIEELKKELGDKFNAIIVGFDTESDTPQMMKEFGAQHETDFNLIRFASGDTQTIARMVKDFGFYYEVMEDGGFNHLGLVTVVDSEGVIYDQVYKTTIRTADLRLPVNQLLSGNIPSTKPPTLIDQLKVLCLKYDPETGEYYIDYPYLLGVLLQAIAVVLLIWFFMKDDIKKLFRGLINRNKEKCKKER